jgi:hypothetical protein
MSGNSRKAAIAGYKERKVAAGIYVISCVALDRQWVGQAADLSDHMEPAVLRASPRRQPLPPRFRRRGARMVRRPSFLVRSSDWTMKRLHTYAIAP